VSCQLRDNLVSEIVGPSEAQIGVPTVAGLLRQLAAPVILGLLVAIVGLACDDTRPSVLLFVMDTTRADAVSSYGHVAGTTPVLDDLARDGVRYARAYSGAPWTLPSHASLFTGLRPSEHGVSWRNTAASEELVMLAERMRDAGYVTLGLSENAWVSRTFGIPQGFDRFRLVGPKGGGLLRVLDTWLTELPVNRSFFLFVNVVDAHAPYLVRDENPYLPGGVTPGEASAISQDRADYLCRADRFPREMSILRGLYLGGVRAADTKLGRVLTRLERVGRRGDLLVVVTSDHGESFGEQRLFDHVAGLDESQLHVPLVVHGLKGRPPAVIHETVSLLAVMPSILSWVGLPVPHWLSHGSLPLSPSNDSNTVSRIAIAERDEPTGPHPKDRGLYTEGLRIAAAAARRGCGERDRVFGAMRTAIAPPFKLIEYDRYPSMLIDTTEKSHAERDIGEAHPDAVAALSAALNAKGTRPPPTPTDTPTDPRALSEENVEAGLRALGYLD